MNSIIFLRFYWGSFVCRVNLRAPPKHIGQIWHTLLEWIHRSLVETDTIYCLGYLAGTELVHFSRRTRSKLCKKKFRDTIKGVGDHLPSESSFIPYGALVTAAPYFVVGLPTIFELLLIIRDDWNYEVISYIIPNFLLNILWPLPHSKCNRLLKPLQLS